MDPDKTLMRTLAVLLGLLGMAGCSGGHDNDASSSDRIGAIEALAADTATGQTLFDSSCASCHGSDAMSGSADKNLPTIVSSDTTLAIDQILNGGEGMASFASLTDQQVADILGYVKTL